ncbi:conserved hypothetical protein [bacterium A37T11]|nr:conserved hypothetical protein [bacterium A37T11]
MKAISFFVSFLTVSGLYAQEPLVTSAHLLTATVFSQGAELNHAASFNLPAGSQEILLNGIANTLDENSIQIGGPAGFTILSVRPVRNYLQIENKSPEYKRVADSLAKANQALEEIRNLQSANESILALLAKNQLIGGDHGTTVIELSKMADYYYNKHISIKNTLSSLALQKARQEQQVARLKKQLEEFNTDQQGTGGQLLLQVMNSKAGPINLSVSYLTGAASWSAYYDLRAENAASPLQIIYKANLQQSTGIPWNKVKLTLSTSNPSQNGTAPLLNPWVLRFAEDYSNRLDEVVVVQNRIQGVKVESNLPQRKTAALPAPSTLNDHSTLTENQLSATFDIDIPYDIASNGKPHSVALKEYTQPARFKYYAAPKIDGDAFLMAEVTDYEKLNLVPGEANIIFENMFVGKSFLNPYATTDTLNLSLGRDKMISIKRERVTEQTSTQSIGSSKKQVFTYEIRVRNNKKQAIQLLLKDQYPLSSDKAIEVELLEDSQASKNSETGVLTWQLDIPPGQTKTLRISYSVKYPKNRNIDQLF